MAEETKRQRPKPFGRSHTEKLLQELARTVIQEHELPRGPVIGLLRQVGIEEAVVERVATRFVPYTLTPKA